MSSDFSNKIVVRPAIILDSKLRVPVKNPVPCVPFETLLGVLHDHKKVGIWYSSSPALAQQAASSQGMTCVGRAVSDPRAWVDTLLTMCRDVNVLAVQFSAGSSPGSPPSSEHDRVIIFKEPNVTAAAIMHAILTEDASFASYAQNAFPPVYQWDPVLFNMYIKEKLLGVDVADIYAQYLTSVLTTFLLKQDILTNFDSPKDLQRACPTPLLDLCERSFFRAAKQMDDVITNLLDPSNAFTKQLVEKLLPRVQPL